MSAKYDPSKIEPKWQKKWASSKLYKTADPLDAKNDSQKGKYYILDMFPYASGIGLHVGHPKGYIATDVISRMKRMQGMNVLHPMGFDSFGLPAENYAIKTKTNPMISVAENIKHFKKQLEIIGFDYDWSREINTVDPAYYKWTQWTFLQMWKKGLAYESNEPVNWCPTDKTVLANEDVENGRCERCGTPVEKKPMRQWVLRITDYADRLLNDLDATDYVMPKLIDKVNPHQPGKPLVKRNVAHAIVYDPKTKKYLIIRNKKFDWDTVVIGGIEGDESPVDTARREVMEETGYTDLEFKRILGGPTEAHYHTKHKGENRVAIAQAVLFELTSDKRVAIATDSMTKDEASHNEVLWIDEKDFVPGKMVNSELPIWLERLNAYVTIDEKTGVPCFNDWGNTSAVRAGLPFVERNAVAAIVKHWKEDKYIGLKWKQVAWQTIITGGPDGNETPEQGALKEIIEETGYLHPKFIRDLGKADSKFFHNPKNVNRYAHFDVMYFELADGECRELSADEQAKHEVVWLTKEEMSDFLSPAAQRYMWDVLFLKKPDRFSPSKPLLDWPESIKEAQRNWIGRSEGALINFNIKEQKGNSKKIEVFTTRPDTLFGVTYVVLAPEHKLVNELLGSVSNKAEVEAYISNAARETEIERTDAKKEKTGVELKGVKAINPANDEEVSVWIADYVLADYGTGAVMAVPAHDERDWEFAKKFGLPIKYVVVPERKGFPEELAFRENEPVVNRNVIRAFVKHWSEDKYALLSWKDNGWKTAISGGIEDGEDPIIAAKREIQEEIGYKNAEFISIIGGPVRAKFYAPNKKQNRIDVQHGLLFKLKDDEKAEVSADEQKIHDMEWVSFEKVKDFVKGTIMDSFLFDRILSGDIKSFVGDGYLINSGQFSGKPSSSVKKDITTSVGGQWVTKYKLRDWVFSRQRYWGEPIPLVHCDKCGVVAVPEKDLPVKLPKVESYEPTGTGESPLATISKWVNVKCPKCKGSAKRETNTMPQWAGSCWYYLRYEDPKNKKALVDPIKEKYWSPVDLYVGGAEHATRHLIYARFWHKFLNDIGVVSTSEPFTKLQSVGLIMGEDGRKMSKRFGNVVNPDDIVKQFGADTLRLYEMFMGPFDQAIAWSTESMVGPRRFIERVWRLSGNIENGDKTNLTGTIDRILQKTIKKVTADIMAMRFNTAVSTLMIAVNEIEMGPTKINRDQFETLLKLLAPFAPHVTEELWTTLGNKKSIHISEWPKYDPNDTIEKEAHIIVQVNGKMRGSFIADREASEEALKTAALALPEVKKWLEGKEIKKVIVVKGRLISIVVI